LVCTKLPPFFVTLERAYRMAHPNNYTYTWYKDNAVVIAGETESDVNTEGQYQVDVTTLWMHKNKNIKVTASDIATITTIDINDFSRYKYSNC
jgi:hypothetical protein